MHRLILLLLPLTTFIFFRLVAARDNQIRLSSLNSSSKEERKANRNWHKLNVAIETLTFILILGFISLWQNRIVYEPLIYLPFQRWFIMDTTMSKYIWGHPYYTSENGVDGAMKELINKIKYGKNKIRKRFQRIRRKIKR